VRDATSAPLASPPYRSRQRAVLFPRKEASGDILGYPCTIVGIQTGSVLAHLQDLDLWVYRVYAPHLGRSLDVAGKDLLVWQEGDASKMPTEAVGAPRRCEIWFTSPVGDDNTEIRGGYRLEGAEPDWFFFRKAPVATASYQLCLSAIEPERRATLYYWLPELECLDVEYVLAALPEVIGPVEFRRRTLS
jgi:hypothetical protein